MTNSPSSMPQFSPQGDTRTVERGLEFQPKFDADGLIAAIVCDTATGDVLMFAWMNAQALTLTLETGFAHFYSRSRRKLWKKGEESGNFLAVTEVRTDCDQDALVIRATVSGAGVACHTGARSCFYRAVTLGALPEAGVRTLVRVDQAQ